VEEFSPRSERRLGGAPSLSNIRSEPSQSASNLVPTSNKKAAKFFGGECELPNEENVPLKARILLGQLPKGKPFDPFAQEPGQTESDQVEEETEAEKNDTKSKT